MVLILTKIIDFLGIKRVLVNITNSAYTQINAKPTAPPPSIPPARGGRPVRHRELLWRGGRGGGEVRLDCLTAWEQIV
jgi:hypothetical protein